MRLLVLEILCAMCFLCLPACNDQATEALSVAPYVGAWTFSSNEDDVTVMQRSFGLDSTSFGFVINEGGAFLERKNAGWCGTPPIAYANFMGTWQLASDNSLHISVGFWGGTENYDVRIVSLTASTLKFKREWPPR